MTSGQPVKRSGGQPEEDCVASYWRDGYTVIRGLFDASEIEAIDRKSVV